MTDLKKQIKTFGSMVLPDEVRKALPLMISVKDRDLPAAQKQLIFEETILKDYKKAIARRRLTWICSSAAIIMLLLPIGLCTMKKDMPSTFDGYQSMMQSEMLSDVSVVSESGSLTSKSDFATITLTDEYIILNERDSVRFSGSPVNSILVPEGKRAIVRFNDNTIISLNAKSRLGIPAGYAKDNRMVYFCGKASFNVNHDEAHTFLVDANIIKTHVLGTEFSINTDPENENFASVALYNGKLEVELPGIATSVSLDPSEAVILKGQNFMKTYEIPASMRKSCNAEVFELDGSIKSLINKISDYYGYTVQTSGEFEDIECHGRIIFTDDSAELLDMLTYLIPIKYRFTDHNTLLLIKTN